MYVLFRSGIRLPYLEIFFRVIRTCSSSALPVLQKEEGKTRNLAHTCMHLINDKRTERLPPVFMIHGVTENRRTWEGVDDIIVMRTGRRVCTIDVRNHGDSDWSDISRVDVMADDIIQLMKDMKVEKAALIGHSLGGLISMNIAQRWPEKTEMVVIEDMVTHVRQELLDGVSHRVKRLMPIINNIPGKATESEAHDMILDYMKKNTDLHEFFSNSMQHYFAIRQVHDSWQWKANMKAILESLKSPEAFVGKMESNPYQGEALFIYGTISEIKVFEHKDVILETFPKAEFVALEGARHAIHSIFPQFLTEVLKFLERTALPTKNANLP